MLGNRIFRQMRRQLRSASLLINSGPGSFANPRNVKELQEALIQGFAMNKTQPAFVIFLCGDAHQEYDLCNAVAGMIRDGHFPYCSVKNPSKPAVSLHCECPGAAIGARVVMPKKLQNLDELGLTKETQMVFGWEPVGFALLETMDEYFQDPKPLSDKGKAEVKVHIANSMEYFDSLGLGWADGLRDQLGKLMKVVDVGSPDQRLTAFFEYTNAALDARLDANGALGDAINESIDGAVRKVGDVAFVHFVSVGNGHIIGDHQALREGESIINYLKMVRHKKILGFSIGRFP